MTDYERGYAEALADCRRIVETEAEYPTAQIDPSYAEMFEKMKSRPREAIAAAVSETKKSLLMRLPTGPKPDDSIVLDGKAAEVIAEWRALSKEEHARIAKWIGFTSVKETKRIALDVFHALAKMPEKKS